MGRLQSRQGRRDLRASTPSGRFQVRWDENGRGTLQVNYGLLTDARGCPVAVSVHEGNVADSQTLMPEVSRLRQDFGVEQLVMVGDRGMLSNQAIEELREHDGIAWITALKSVSIRALIEQGQLQLDLFDERNLDKIKARVDAGKLVGPDEIGVRVGKVINQYQVAKHFELAIGEARFSFSRKGKLARGREELQAN